MFYFRLNKIKILKNREFIGPAEVQIMSFITTDKTPLPGLEGFLNENDPAKKKLIIADAVKASLQSNIFPEITRIKDNHVFFFGDTGIALLVSDQIPDNFNWQLMVYDSDERTRDNATLALNIIQDPEFDTFVNNLGTLVGAISNPLFAVGVQVAKFITTTTLKIVQKNKDDQIGAVLMSLNRTQHYLHGIRNSENVPDLSGNMFVDYSIFATNANR